MSVDGTVTCIIYDCDGVLFDSLEANSRLYNRIAEAVGRGPLSPAELRYCHTHTVYESIHCMFPDNPEKEARATVFLREEIDLRDFIVYLTMEPHLIEVLGELKERGILRAISTNRTTSMKHIMERFGLWSYFDMVVTALDVANPKPNPESVEKILAALKLPKEEVLFIGDSEVDWQTAQSAGVRFIAYKNLELTSRGSSYGLIDDHREVLDYLPCEAHPR